MEKKIVYNRKNKLLNEQISITEAYKVYALNNDLPVFNEKLKEDGDYYVFLNEAGLEENKPASFTYDEMIAKIIYTLFKDKNIYVNGKIVNDYIAKKDANGLADYLVSELEHDIQVEVLKMENNESEGLVLRFGKNNVLNMNVGAVAYDEKNEIHCAFGRVRRAMIDIAEGLCE